MADLKVTLIQSDIHWENRDKNLSMFTEKISSVKEETDLIVLPEMFTSGFTMNASSLAEKMNGPAIRWMQEMAQEKNCILTGSLIIEENGHYYNRLVWMTPDGFQHYDKRHLFSLAGEEKTYTSGRNRLFVTIKDWKIFPLICYDLRFPVWSRRSKNTSFDLLLYIASWPYRRVYAWKQLLIARAIENHCYTIGLNRYGDDGNGIFHSGDSAVLNFKGESVEANKNPGEFIKTFNLQKEPLDVFRRQFPFFNDSDGFEIIV